MKRRHYYLIYNIMSSNSIKTKAGFNPLTFLVVSFLVPVTKYPDKSDLREKGFILAYSLQGLEAAGSVLSAVREP